MHPRQIPVIIGVSMLLMLSVVVTIVGAAVAWYPLAVAGSLITALLGLLLGRYMPKPYDHSINEVVKELRTISVKLDEVVRIVEVSPFALQERIDSLQKVERALALLLKEHDLIPGVGSSNGNPGGQSNGVVIAKKVVQNGGDRT